MRFGSLGTKFSYVIVFASGMVTAWLAMPLWREIVIQWNQERYGELVYQCDTAMRDHLIARQVAVESPSRETGLELASAEVGLLDCQDYDIFQKRLMQWGLREEELSLMRLEAIEARASDLAEVIEAHEIRY